MEGYYGRIRALLNITRKRVFALTLFRGSLYFAGVNLAYCNIFCLLDALVEFSANFRYFFFGGYLVVLFAAIFIFLIRPVSGKLTDDKAALLVQRQDSRLKDDIINFLQLSRKFERGELKETSREITEEYLKRSDSKIVPAIFSGVRAFPGLRKEGMFFCVLLIIFSVLCVFPPYLMKYSLLRLFDPSLDTSAVSNYRVLTGIPEIGDLKVKVHYPAYTGMDVKIFEEGGNAEALKNSRLEISGTASKPVAGGFAAGTEGGRDFYSPLNIADPLRPAFSLVIKEDLEYKIGLTDRQGRSGVERVFHNIKVIRDENPRVNMIFPNQELIAAPDAELKVVYEYTDDFGVTSVNLVCEKHGQEKRTPLVRNAGTKLHDSGELELDLAKAGLTFGDDLGLYVEAFDNDVLDGPKRGVSQKVRIKIPSLQEYLKQEDPAEAENFEELLKSADNFKNRQEDFLAQLEKLKISGEPDLARMLADLEGLQNDLAKLAEKLMATALKVPEETLKNAQMSRLDMGKIAKLLKELEASIRSGDKEAAKRLAQELNNAMSEMLESLRKMLESSGMARQRNMLKQAGELGKAIKEMLREEKNIYADTAKEAAEGLKELLAGQEKLIEEIIKKQQEAVNIAGQTFNGLAEKKLGEYTETVKGIGVRELVPLTGKLLKDLKENIFSSAVVDLTLAAGIAESGMRYCGVLEQQASLRLAELKKITGTEEARKIKEKERDGLAEINAGLKKVGGIEKEILVLFQSAAKGKNNGENKDPACEGLKKKQEELKNKLSKFKEKLNFAGADGFPAGAFQNDISGAEEGMKNASEELQGKDAYGALDGEQAAISHLEDLGKGMEELPQGGGASGSGPAIFSAAGGSNGGRGGNRGIHTGKQKLPQKKEYKPPKEFREDILDAMKEKLPQKYKDLVEEYYKKLLR